MLRRTLPLLFFKPTNLSAKFIAYSSKTGISTENLSHPAPVYSFPDPADNFYKGRNRNDGDNEEALVLDENGQIVFPNTHPLSHLGYDR